MDMPSWLPMLVNLTASGVIGVSTALWALWKAQHAHELKMQQELAQIRENYVKESKLDVLLGDIRRDAAFIRSIVLKLANRLSIPTAVDADG